MKYFLDTEFIEDGKTIDLISIGIACEDGREYYAVSSEFNPSKASDWVVENVLSLMGIGRNGWVATPDLLSPSQKEHWMAQRTREQIRLDILRFMKPELGDAGGFIDDNHVYICLKNAEIKDSLKVPEIWGYYADYDWVVFCQLFGTMMDLPKGFPMYCRDIKQLCDELKNPPLPEQSGGEHNALEDARWNKLAYEFLISVNRVR